jgi:two-component system chemotaxis sensor kinase CheA
VHGVMSNERSAIINTWLGPAEPLMTFADYLERRLPQVAADFRFCWREVVAGDMLLELTLDQMPRGFVIDGRHYQVSYTPILKANQLQKVLLVISDVTAGVEREILELQQREVVNVYERAARDRQGFLEFVSETDAQIAAIEHGNIEDPAILKRIIHTLKGNTLLFDVRSVGDLCHRMETRMAEEQIPPSAAERAELGQRWARVRLNMKTIFGDREIERVELDNSEYEALLRAVQTNQSRDGVARMILDLKLEPTSKRLARLGEQAQSIARRLNKGPLIVEVDDRGLRLDPARWASFWAACTHVLRNAIDHGLESPEHRVAMGKLKHGMLRLCTRIVGDQFVIEIADDGRGIDWQAVARSASRKGLPHGAESELIDALFHDGITTSTEVNEFSGRGIGMGAVLAACEARGGTLHIISEAGRGTRVEFRFPRQAMASDARPSTFPRGSVMSTSPGALVG